MIVTLPGNISNKVNIVDLKIHHPACGLPSMHCSGTHQSEQKNYSVSSSHPNDTRGEESNKSNLCLLQADSSHAQTADRSLRRGLRHQVRSPGGGDPAQARKHDLNTVGKYKQVPSVCSPPAEASRRHVCTDVGINTLQLRWKLGFFGATCLRSPEA